MTPSIRNATAADAESIATVQIQSWRETYRGLLADTVLDDLRHEDRAGLWKRIIASNAQYPMNAQFVAEAADKFVGFGSCGLGRSRDCLEAGYEGEISALYVLKSYQNHGFGSAIFDLMLTHLVSGGLASVSLWVLDTNTPARDFYERRGGVAFGTRTENDHGRSVTDIAYGWSDLRR